MLNKDDYYCIVMKKRFGVKQRDNFLGIKHSAYVMVANKSDAKRLDGA